MELFTHIDEVSIYFSYTSFSLKPLVKNLTFFEPFITAQIETLDIDPYFTAIKHNHKTEIYNLYLNVFVGRDDLCHWL
ncbi:MAG: hypothetical protein NZ853_01335 [Leptospiraceae bacterium]|nr:hypothetical protein [Leptospiraceae bacterium]MDW7976129.1 hypothetical protein [Leptospiraceae bacterium]